MKFIHLVFPLLGAIILIASYVLILVKRAQKQRMLNQDAPINNQLKIMDQSEKFWWPLTLATVLFTYIGLIAMILLTTNFIGVQDSIFFGAIFFAILLILGYKFVA